MPFSSTKKSDHHNITEILFKVALNTINQTLMLKYIIKLLDFIYKFREISSWSIMHHISYRVPAGRSYIIYLIESQLVSMP